MDIEEYKERVVNLFKSGKASDEQWAEMAVAVLEKSESDGKATWNIDEAIHPDSHRPLTSMLDS